MSEGAAMPRNAPPPPVPIPAVSGAAFTRAARVKVKIKGASDGPIFEGSKVISPCRGCPQ